MDKSKVALLIIDMQNAFVKKEGSLSKLGINTSRTSNVIEPIKAIKAAAKKANMPVVYLKMAMRADYKDAGILQEVFPPLKDLGHCVIDTWDNEIIEELAPDKDDILVDKHTFSGFYNTKLESILRNLNIDTLIVTGIATNICVESTVRDGFVRNFKIIVPKEATASYDEIMEQGSFINFEFGFAKIESVEEVLKKLND
jgi:ureidoacrylate peracid hydrolase